MRLVGFLQAWDLLRDELGREPALEEYAGRFGLDVAVVARDRARFERAFGGATPGVVLDALWDWHDSRRGAQPAANPPRVTGPHATRTSSNPPRVTGPHATRTSSAALLGSGP